jgi:hypothetical protein
MKHWRLFKTTAAAGCALAVLIVGGLLIHSPRAEAQNQGNDDESKIKRGFAIAPVELNLKGKNHALVGLGSYIVNAVGDCNGCHSAGPATEFLPGGNPYFLAGAPPPLFGGTKQVNTATYLGGGRDFGQLGNPPTGAHIVSRNLTPDFTGRAVGGDSLSEFIHTMRSGADPDSLHPFTCPGGTPATCVPFPFDPAKLLVMRWPNFADMTDHDLEAIYEYLSAIPCIPGPSNPSDPFYAVLHHDCGHP